MAQLNVLKTKLATDTTLCTIGESDCVALMLGTMERSAVMGGLWPFSESYTHSFNHLAYQTRMLNIRALCVLHSKQDSSPDTSAATHPSYDSLFSQTGSSPLNSSSSPSNLFSLNSSSSQSTRFAPNSSSSQSIPFSHKPPSHGLFGKPPVTQAPVGKPHDVAGTLVGVVTGVERWPVFAKGLDLKDFTTQQ
jgi:hypothetical protein